MHKYMKQILTNLKGNIDSNTIIVGDLSTPLSAMDRLSRGKNQQENNRFELHCRPKWIKQTYAEHPTTEAEYIFFSLANGTFSRISHMLGHKTYPKKYKKAKIIPSFISEHNYMKLEVCASHSVMSDSLWSHSLPGSSVHGILQARIL